VCKRLLSLFLLIAIHLSAYLPFSHAESLPDPTRPTSSKAPNSTKNSVSYSWILSSTLISKGQRTATINGKLVSIGQYINSAKVVSIQPNEVWLIYKQKRFRIKLLARNIKDFSRSAAK